MIAVAALRRLYLRRLIYLLLSFRAAADATPASATIRLPCCLCFFAAADAATVFTFAMPMMMPLRYFRCRHAAFIAICRSFSADLRLIPTSLLPIIRLPPLTIRRDYFQLRHTPRYASALDIAAMP